MVRSPKGKSYPLDPALAIFLLPEEQVLFVADHGFALEVKPAQNRPQKLAGHLIKKKQRIFFHNDGSVKDQLFDLNFDDPFTQQTSQGFVEASFETSLEVFSARVLSYPANAQKGFVELVLADWQPSEAEQLSSLQTKVRKVVESYGVFLPPDFFSQRVAHHQPTADHQGSIDSSPSSSKGLESSFAADPFQEERIDLRDKNFITIDGETAKDFDDAILLEKTPAGYDLYVAIADVAAYVPAFSTLDKQAHALGFSLYLPGMVHPMLPERLSNGLCSLRPDEDKLTITCLISYTPNLDVVKTTIFPSLIRSKARLSYEKIEAGLAKENGKFAWRLADFYQAAWLEPLNLYLQVAERLARRRKENGAIDFDFPEPEIQVDDQLRPIDIKKRLPSPARRLIEQFMLEANTALAKFCRKNRIPIYYRNHLPPSRVKLAELERKAAGLLSKKTRVKNAHQLNALFQAAEDSPLLPFLKYNALRAMSKADYGTESDGHYGLGLENYCHFTSPIRRFADLFLHQNLSLFWQRKKLLKATLKTAKHLSKQERLYAKIERSVGNLYLAEFLALTPEKIYDALVIEEMAKGVMIQIESPFVEGFLLFPRKRFKAPKKQASWLQLRLKVRFLKYNDLMEGLDFEWVSF